MKTSGSIILTDPQDNTFSYGTVDEIDDSTYVCNFPVDTHFSAGQVLKYASVFHAGNCINCSVQIVDTDDGRKNLAIRIKDLYEAC